MYLQKKFIKMKFFLILTVLLGYSHARVFHFPSDRSDDSKKELDWWQKTIFYQIYPRSFKDSDGDGIGDLKGISEKLQYLKDSGIDATWLSPIFKSPGIDMGYDISDYRSISPEYGNMVNFDYMMKRAKEIGIKIVLDFVPNHTSDQHEWFQKSIDRDPEYENYYVWHDGKILEDGTRGPPNNWLSVFRGSAWEWNEKRQQYYLHLFTKEQPDLNFREPKMVKAMKDVLIFWLDKGVDGFRVDAVPYLVEDDHWKDEPLSNIPGVSPDEFDYLDHIYTVNRPMNFEVIRGWCDTVEEYARTHDQIPRVMMTEAYAPIETQMKYYDAGVSFSFNFVFVGALQKTSTAEDYKNVINKWRLAVPEKYTPNWVVGNHDNARIGTAVGSSKIDAINMMILTLPGIGVTYYGEEIGMENGDVKWEEHNDPVCTKEGFESGKFCRDFARTPFQWTDGYQAGFTSGKPWLPVSSSYKKLNLGDQQAVETSHWKVYRDMAFLRTNRTFQYGSTDVKAITKNVLLIERTLKDNWKVFYIFNTGDTDQKVKLADDGQAEVAVKSINAEYYKQGQTVNLTEVFLSPSGAYLLIQKNASNAIGASILCLFICFLSNLLQ